MHAVKTERPGTAPTLRRNTEKAEAKEEEKLSYEEWCYRKDVFDRGLELLGKLDSARWEGAEAYDKLTEALVAIDEALGVDAEAEVRRKAAGAARTMYEVWQRQSMHKHALVNVPLTPADEAQLTETVKQYAERTEVVLGPS